MATRQKGTGNIVRYPNRRLYDSDQGGYITIDDVERRVLSGQRVRIVNKKDDIDVTGYVLLQVLAERAKVGNNCISVETLCGYIKKPEPGAKAPA